MQAPFPKHVTISTETPAPARNTETHTARGRTLEEGPGGEHLAEWMFSASKVISNFLPDHCCLLHELTLLLLVLITDESVRRCNAHCFSKPIHRHAGGRCKVQSELTHVPSIWASCGFSHIRRNKFCPTLLSLIPCIGIDAGHVGRRRLGGIRGCTARRFTFAKIVLNQT